MDILTAQAYIKIDDAVAYRGSTATFTVTLTDTTDTQVVPVTLNYSLIDKHDRVIDSIYEISASPLALSTVILLYGDNLELEDNEADALTVERLLVVKGTYNSDLGAGLPFAGWCKFWIANVPEAIEQTTTTTT